MPKKIIFQLEPDDVKLILDCLEERKWSIDRNKMRTEENRIHAILYVESIIERIKKGKAQ